MKPRDNINSSRRLRALILPSSMSNSFGIVNVRYRMRVPPQADALDEIGPRNALLFALWVCTVAVRRLWQETRRETSKRMLKCG